MNIVKYLRERAEQEAEKLITEEDLLFIKELAKKTVESENGEKAKKHRRKKRRK